MNAHNIDKELFRAEHAVDPGDAGTVTVDRSPHVVALVSAGAETRTLARPTRAGARCFLYMKTDGGDITLTVTGGFNEDGDTTFTFSDPGQFVEFVASYDGTNYFWRKVSDYGLGNIAPGDAAILDEFSGLTATVAEINQYCDESGKTEIVTTTNVITAAESGKTFFLNAAGGFVSTLPAPALGLNYTFIVMTSFTSSATIVTTSSSNVVCGQVYTVDVNSGTDPDFTATADQDTITLVANKCVKGDRVQVWCDGTSWYVNAFCSVFDAITLDQAS